jgi:uncharacterized membrane protein
MHPQKGGPVGGRRKGGKKPQTEALKADMRKRYWEIDALRGLCVVVMIVYHTLFNLADFGFTDMDFSGGFPWYFARVFASIFMLIAGLSLTLRSGRKGMAFSGYAKRGGTLFAIGLCFTAVSYFVLGPRFFVLFGVLHLVGLSTILSFPLLKRPRLSFALGCAVLAAGLILGKYRFPFYWLSFLGFRPEGYYPVDYLPILPWMSYILFGISLGNLLYPGGKRRFPVPELSRLWPIRAFAFLGRHSLPIYVAHLPVIYGVLELMSHAV